MNAHLAPTPGIERAYCSRMHRDGCEVLAGLVHAGIPGLMPCQATSRQCAEQCPAQQSANSVQYMAVMRHSRREDESNENWVLTAGRPWDPPISEEGIGLVSNLHFCTQCQHFI